MPPEDAPAPGANRVPSWRDPDPDGPDPERVRDRGSAEEAAASMILLNPDGTIAHVGAYLNGPE